MCVHALVFMCIEEKRASAEMLAFHAGSSLQALLISKNIYQPRVYYTSFSHMHFSGTEQRKCYKYK